MTDIVAHLRTIGTAGEAVLMRDIKPLSGLTRDDAELLRVPLRALPAARRLALATAMRDLHEDNVDLDFVQLLLVLLEDADARVRLVTVGALWEDTTARVMRGLIERLAQDEDALVRAEAALSLGRFAYMATLDEIDEHQGDLVRAALLGQLASEQDVDVRRRLVESCGYYGEAAPVQAAIAAAAVASDQLQRESALAAMGHSMDPRWLPQIAAALNERSPALRYEAARAAGEFADLAADQVARLAQLTQEEDTEVATTAIWALGQIGGAQAQRVLQSLTRSTDDARKQAALEAIDELLPGSNLFAGAVTRRVRGEGEDDDDDGFDEPDDSDDDGFGDDEMERP